MNTKDKIRAGEISIGTWLTIPHPSVVEILATAGFEWICLDLEHAAIDVESAMNLIAHIQGNGMKAFVRVTKNEEVVIKKMLDAGADGLIVPMIKNLSEAKEMLDYIISTIRQKEKEE
jgi:2-keto-3-deoxy-L-rhamnonate aldolase RhmA